MKLVKALVVGMLILLVAVPMAGAQGGGNWDSSFNVVNLGTANATVTVTFYAENGTPTTPTQLGTSTGPIGNPFTLAPGSSVEVLPFQTDELADGRYSVVISADQPVAAIANLTNWIAQGGVPYYNGSYSGAADEGTLPVYMPAIVNGYYDWNSHLSIQNLSGSALDITADFYTEGAATVCHTETNAATPAYSSWHLDVGALDLSACDVNADGYNGSAIVSASGPLAVVDNQTADTSFYGLSGRTQTYNGFTAGGMTLYAPALYYNYYGWDSSINVQNIGAAATDVTVTYSDGYVATVNVPAGASTLFYQWQEGQDGHHTALTAFGATITAAEPLVAVVNAASNQPNAWGTPQDQAQSYNAFAAGGTSIGFPLIMREYYGWYTSYTIQNVGSADVNVLISYSGISTCQNLDPGAPIPAGGNLEVYQGGPTDALCTDLPGAEQPGNPWGSSYRGAVTVEVQGTGAIIGIVNQTNYYNRTTVGNTGDWSMSYNGIVQ
jgi:hypothetical protein